MLSGILFNCLDKSLSLRQVQLDLSSCFLHALISIKKFKGHKHPGSLRTAIKNVQRAPDFLYPLIDKNSSVWALQSVCFELDRTPIQSPKLYTTPPQQSMPSLNAIWISGKECLLGKLGHGDHRVHSRDSTVPRHPHIQNCRLQEKQSSLLGFVCLRYFDNALFSLLAWWHQLYVAGPCRAVCISSRPPLIRVCRYSNYLFHAYFFLLILKWCVIHKKTVSTSLVQFHEHTVKKLQHRAQRYTLNCSFTPHQHRILYYAQCAVEIEECMAL